MVQKNNIDWAAMEPDWRAGLKSVLQLSKEHRVSRAAIIKHWNKAGVERDLAAKIRAKADALVARAVVTQAVTPNFNTSEKQIIESNADILANVRLIHRRDIQRNRILALNLMAELEQMTDDRNLFAKLGEFLSNPSADGNPLVIDKLIDAFYKVVSLPSRVDSVKKLADTLRVLIGLERQAFSIDDHKSDKGHDIEDAIRRIDEAVANGGV